MDDLRLRVAGAQLGRGRGEQDRVAQQRVMRQKNAVGRARTAPWRRDAIAHRPTIDPKPCGRSAGHGRIRGYFFTLRRKKMLLAGNMNAKFFSYLRGDRAKSRRAINANGKLLPKSRRLATI